MTILGETKAVKVTKVVVVVEEVTKTFQFLVGTVLLDSLLLFEIKNSMLKKVGITNQLGVKTAELLRKKG